VRVGRASAQRQHGRLHSGECLGWRKQRHRPAAPARRARRARERIARARVVSGQREHRDLERLQQRERLPALHGVLRLVLRAGRAPPADQQQHRAAVDVRVRRTEQRVDRVAQPRVLHVHQRQLSRGEVVAQRQPHRSAFVGRNHVTNHGSILTHVATTAHGVTGCIHFAAIVKPGELRAKGCEQRVWYSGVEANLNFVRSVLQ
jgi:hypothetical protein